MHVILQGGNPPHIPGRISPALSACLHHAAALFHLAAHVLPHCR